MEARQLTAAGHVVHMTYVLEVDRCQARAVARERGVKPHPREPGDDRSGCRVVDGRPIAADDEAISLGIPAALPGRGGGGLQGQQRRCVSRPVDPGPGPEIRHEQPVGVGTPERIACGVLIQLERLAHVGFRERLAECLLRRRARRHLGGPRREQHAQLGISVGLILRVGVELPRIRDVPLVDRGRALDQCDDRQHDRNHERHADRPEHGPLATDRGLAAGEHELAL
jgi:hypothetical protein